MKHEAPDIFRMSYIPHILVPKPGTEDYYQVIVIAVASLQANEVTLMLPRHQIIWQCLQSLKQRRNVTSELHERRIKLLRAVEEERCKDTVSEIQMDQLEADTVITVDFHDNVILFLESP